MFSVVFGFEVCSFILCVCVCVCVCVCHLVSELLLAHPTLLANLRLSEKLTAALPVCPVKVRKTSESEASYHSRLLFLTCPHLYLLTQQSTNINKIARLTHTF